MKIDAFLKLFVPRDDSFFPLFEEAAGVLIRASELLQQLMDATNLEERAALIKQIKAAEHEGDDLTHKIYQQLNKSFITPFDREDIQELTSKLDDVIDFINGTAQRIGLYKPKQILPPLKELADVIHEAAGEIWVDRCWASLYAFFPGLQQGAGKLRAWFQESAAKRGICTHANPQPWRRQLQYLRCLPH